ncbi:hypothetical protein DL96DRAFT_1456906, partial [Flagelloscypha sp. PMI_526]
MGTPIQSLGREEDRISLGETKTRDTSLKEWTSRLVQHDTAFINQIIDDCNTTLPFSALFSAVVTAFIIEGIKSFQPTDQQPIVDILLALSSHQPNFTLSSSISLPPSSSQFKVKSTDQAATMLFLVSLTVSLFVALYAMRAKQWLREFLQWGSISDKTALRVRQIRWEQLHASKVELFVAILPTLLQVSVYLFVTGLALFLWDINRPAALITLI